MLPASRAAIVPVFIATPTSACASAGASLVPSPHIATSLPLRLLVADQLELVLGRRLREEVVDPGLGGDGGRGQRVVAGDHHGADAHLPQLGEALADAALDDVLQVDDAEQAAVLGDGERRAALSGDARRRSRSVSRTASETGARAMQPARAAATAPTAGRCCRLRQAPESASTAPLRIEEPSTSMPLIRVCAENGTNLALSGAISRARKPYFSLARTTIERPSGVSSESEASCAASASSRSLDAGQRQELGRLAVAERDRAGLVEQQACRRRRPPRPRGPTWRAR